MSWAHRQDDEWRAFTEENVKGDGTLLFGRVTYEMMARFWPTPEAVKALPAVARRMNGGRKVVFSRTLDQASWSNTLLVKGDPAAEVARMKREPGPDLVVLGSATIVPLLAQARLVDEFQLAVAPVVLGSGKSMFAGIGEPLALRLKATRTFGNGSVLLTYEPAR
jgi:dihydrofolate reductase